MTTDRRQSEAGGRRADDSLDPLSSDIQADFSAHANIAVAASELPDLDELFNEAMGKLKVAADAKDARERVRRGGQSAAEMAADAERIRKWEMAHQWRAEANVAAFEVIRCETCNTSHTVFSGLMQRQSNRTDRYAQRWVAVAAVVDGLPNEIAHRHLEKPMCEDCAPSYGWDLTQEPTEWK